MKHTLKLMVEAAETMPTPHRLVDMKAVDKQLDKIVNERRAEVTRQDAKIRQSPKVQRLYHLFQEAIELLQALPYGASSKRRERDELVNGLARIMQNYQAPEKTERTLQDITDLLSGTKPGQDLTGSKAEQALEDAVQAFDDLYKAMYEGRGFMSFIDHPLSDVWDLVALIKDPLSSQREAERTIRETLRGDILKELDGIAREVEAAIERLGPTWNASRVSIDASVRVEERNDSGYSTTPSVHVGDYLFSVWQQGTKLVIDDIEEADPRGDEREGMVDYQLLISELREPGSVSREGSRVITLYTARPVQDRERLLAKRELPAGIFLASDIRHVEGLAYDLSADTPRDIWRVRIEKRYLLQTLSGRVEYYQIVGKGTVPVKMMELY
jgi:hypothetical protein